MATKKMGQRRAPRSENARFQRRDHEDGHEHLRLTLDPVKKQEGGHDSSRKDTEPHFRVL